MQIIPNLTPPDQTSIPTADDADEVIRGLFVTNSKFLEMENQQREFETIEQATYNRNSKLDSTVMQSLYLELAVVVLIGTVQYIVMRHFVNKIKRM